MILSAIHYFAHANQIPIKNVPKYTAHTFWKVSDVRFLTSLLGNFLLFLPLNCLKSFTTARIDMSIIAEVAYKNLSWDIFNFQLFCKYPFPVVTLSLSTNVID